MRTSVANVQIEDFELWFAKRKFLIFKDFSLVAEVRYRIPPSPPVLPVLLAFPQGSDGAPA